MKNRRMNPAEAFAARPTTVLRQPQERFCWGRLSSKQRCCPSPHWVERPFSHLGSCRNPGIAGRTGLKKCARSRRRPSPESSRENPATGDALQIRQSLMKTVTFRVIVAAVDFSGNLLILGELGAAAGLSAFSLVVGPFFYFIHEVGWNGLQPPAHTPQTAPAIKADRALAKTISYRAFATIPEFSANYIVAGDLRDALLMSGISFVAGPFIYWGHEKFWERAAAPKTVQPVDAGHAGIGMRALATGTNHTA